MRRSFVALIAIERTRLRSRAIGRIASVAFIHGGFCMSEFEPTCQKCGSHEMDVSGMVAVCKSCGWKLDYERCMKMEHIKGCDERSISITEYNEATGRRVYAVPCVCFLLQDYMKSVANLEYKWDRCQIEFRQREPTRTTLHQVNLPMPTPEAIRQAQKDAEVLRSEDEVKKDEADNRQG